MALHLELVEGVVETVVQGVVDGDREVPVVQRRAVEGLEGDVAQLFAHAELLAVQQHVEGEVVRGEDALRGVHLHVVRVVGVFEAHLAVVGVEFLELLQRHNLDHAQVALHAVVGADGGDVLPLLSGAIRLQFQEEVLHAEAQPGIIHPVHGEVLLVVEHDVENCAAERVRFVAERADLSLLFHVVAEVPDVVQGEVADRRGGGLCRWGLRGVVAARGHPVLELLQAVHMVWVEVTGVEGDGV